MKFSVIIPVYGQWELAQQCLISLKENVKSPFEVLFIDNGAVDLPDCLASVQAPMLGKTLFGENFIYIAQEKNLNFAKACNLGAKLANTPLLFFLNSDTVILENSIEVLLEAIKDPSEKKMLAPVLLYPPNDKQKELTIQHLGISITESNQAIHLYEHFPASHPLVYKKRDLQAITAAAFFIYKEHFLELNGFDEDFINGFEDVEFCARFKNNGGSLEIIPQAKILHLCSQSIGRGASNTHNSTTLMQKEGAKYLRPDYEKLVNNDGYILRFDPFCETIPYPSEELENTFKEIVEENNLEKLKKMHAKEPYWHAGMWAIINHADMSLLEKARLIHSASLIYVEPRVFIEYIKITASLISLSIEEMNGILSEHFSLDIDIRLPIITQKTFSTERINKLQAFAKKVENSPRLSKDCAFHIANNDNFLAELQKDFEELKAIAK